MERKTYFKVVRKLDLISLIESSYVISYKIGKCVQTHPKLAARGYHLLVFGSLSSAINFVEGIGGRIFSCHIKGRLSTLPAIKNNADHVFSSLLCGVGPTHWPRGTVMTKEVKLLKEITE